MLSKDQEGNSPAVASCNLFLAEGYFSNPDPKPATQVFTELTISLCLMGIPQRQTSIR